MDLCYMLQTTLKIATTSIPYSYNRNRILLHRTTVHFLAGIDAAPQTAVAALVATVAAPCARLQHATPAAMSPLAMVVGSSSSREN